MKTWVYIFQPCCVTLGFTSCIFPRSGSILEPLCFCFPAAPSEAQDTHSKHFSWLIKLSILTAHTGNCNQIFHFMMFLLLNLSETHLETPTFYSQIIIWATLIIGWVISRKSKGYLIPFCTFHFSFWGASYTMTGFPYGGEHYNGSSQLYLSWRAVWSCKWRCWLLNVLSGLHTCSKFRALRVDSFFRFTPVSSLSSFLHRASLHAEVPWWL